MTTAREQARKAGVKAGGTWHRHTHAKDYPCDCHRAAADAASDVWEPLVRDLLDVAYRRDSLRPSRVHDVIARAKEALG